MRSRGTVENKNNYQPRSLNKTKRQRELLRLTHENQVTGLTVTSWHGIINPQTRLQGSFFC